MLDRLQKKVETIFNSEGLLINYDNGEVGSSLTFLAELLSHLLGRLDTPVKLRNWSEQ